MINKFEIRNTKHETNSKYEILNPKREKNGKRYDLEERTLLFARHIRSFIKKFPKTLINAEDLKQLLRSSGSVGANYIEANESLGKKDFLMRIRICRKEAKESRFWLDLLETELSFADEKRFLVQEAQELMRIFGAILRQCEV